MAAYRVGVVIPAGSCPCEQVRSVLPQITERDRLVVAWNGTSSSHDCQRGACAHPAVLWLDLGRQLGPARARNLGAAGVADTAVLAFCDADDRVARGWLDELC